MLVSLTWNIIYRYDNMKIIDGLKFTKVSFELIIFNQLQYYNEMRERGGSFDEINKFTTDGIRKWMLWINIYKIIVTLKINSYSFILIVGKEKKEFKF